MPGVLQDTDAELAEAKFRSLDATSSEVLYGPSLPELADWVWAHFYPNGATLTPEERDKLVAKLLPRQQKSGGEPALTLKDFLKWFVSVRDRVPKEEQTKSPPTTPSVAPAEDNGAPKARELDMSANFPAQSSPVATPTPTPTAAVVDAQTPTVIPTFAPVAEDDASLRSSLRVLTETLVDMQTRVQPTVLNSDDATLTTLANSLEAERVRNGKLIRIQKRLQDDLASAEEASMVGGEERLAESERQLAESKEALQRALVGEHKAREEVQQLQETLDSVAADVSRKRLEEEIAFHKERNKSLEAALASLRNQQASVALGAEDDAKRRAEGRELQARVDLLEDELSAALRAGEAAAQTVGELREEAKETEQRDAASNAQQLRRDVLRLESAVAEWKQRAADLEDEVVAERALRRLQADLQVKMESAEERAERAESLLADAEARALAAEGEVGAERAELQRVKAIADAAEGRKRELMTSVEKAEARAQKMQLEAEQEVAAKELLLSQLRQARNQVEEAQRQLLLSDTEALAREDAAGEAAARLSVATQQLAEARAREEELQRALREAFEDCEREGAGRAEDALLAEKREAALEGKIREIVAASFQAKQEAQRQQQYKDAQTARMQKAAPPPPPSELEPGPSVTEEKRAVRTEAPLARAAPPPRPAATPPETPPGRTQVERQAVPVGPLLNLPPTRASLSTGFRPAGISTPGYGGAKGVTSPGPVAVSAGRTVAEASDVSPGRHRWINTTTVV